MSNKEKMAEKVKNVSKEDPFLIEFKAPRELVEMFDAKSKSRFSSRSEAIRALMRKFLDETAQNFCEELTCEVASTEAIGSHPLPSGRDWIVDRLEWQGFINELRVQWRLLWRDRIDDRVRAEGIADKDYSSLFVDSGTVIVATRDYKPPDFVEILEKHKPAEVDNVVPPSPSVGGWGKFARTVLSRQKRLSMRGRSAPPKPSRDKAQPSKKGGRGWLHFRR